MRVPFSWLSEYVELDGLNPQEVADKLTMGAFEVEEVRRLGGGIEGPVVVGEILEINALPKTSKVRLTKVKVDSNSDPLEIICGAQNIQVGQVIPVALPGAIVINRKDGSALAIKAAPIYGVVSNGMLCSPPELGLTGGDSEGILIFDKTAGHKLGQDVRTILSLTEEFVLHVSPRSNRGDALSIKGLSREVAALTGRPMKEPNWKLPSADPGNEKSGTYKIQIEKSEDCELFTIRYVSDIKVSESPEFIKRRLEAIGVRCVNNIVDITNYVLHELGQPLHAYDADKIVGQTFAVRRARKGETIKTLDGKTRSLSDEVLVIADGKELVGVAGIMGGLDSEISNGTTRLALEAASFQPARVRRGGRLLGLSSEASLRFERGVDVNTTARASDRAAYLVSQHCGQAKLGPMSKSGSEGRKPIPVSLRLGQIKRLLDIGLSEKEVKQMLAPLGFEAVEGKNKDNLDFLVPSFRQQDVTREIDLVEEVSRIYGYERLPQSMPKSTTAANLPNQTPARIRQALSGQGLSEAFISSLVPPEVDEPDSGGPSEEFNFGTQDTKSLVRVLNPLSKEHQVMRQSLLPGLLQAAKYNRDHGAKDIWLFELGRAYFRRQHGNSGNTSAASKDHSREHAVEEPLKVGGILTGNLALSRWTEQSNPNEESQNGGSTSQSETRTSGQPETIDFYIAKGVVENLFNHLRIDNEALRYSLDKDAPPVMHPGKAARITFVCTSEKEPLHLGWLGEIHPGCADKLGLDFATYLFELDVALLNRFSRAPLFAAIVGSPAISRDLTIDLKNSIDNARALACIKAAAGGNFKRIELISKFPLSNELKSLSYRLTFQHAEQTLRSEEVDTYLEKIRTALKSELGASFRL